MSWNNVVPYLATLAAVLMLIGFTFRNPLKLRTFAILGNLTFIAYYALISETPLWTAILSAVAIIAVNIYMMWRILKDRKMFRLSAEELMLFARLPGLTPGQYKSLLEISEWHHPQASMLLTTLGAMPKALYYVLEGKVEVNRDDKRFTIGPHAFIGELAFLRRKPATATTFGNAGALLVSWDYEALRALMTSNDGIRKAFDSMLSIDMAEKMAKLATPHLQEQAA